MPIEDIQQYVDKLIEANELKIIKSEVNVKLEIAEILRRYMYSNGPAILFENVKDYDMPVLGNAFGSLQRLKIGLETDNFTEIGERIVNMTKMEIQSGFLNKIKKIPEISKIGDIFPKQEKNGPIHEVFIEEPNLNKIPVLKSWYKDAGKFITFGLVTTKHPETGVRNIGVYRIQIVDNKHAIIHWQIHKRSAQHSMLWKSDKKIEVAIILGADPATIFASVAPVPEGLDKYVFAGIVRKKGVKITKCKTIDLDVPANSEIVLEGYVNPEDLREEGPFGDHTGYYTPKDLFPVFTLTGMMKKENPVYLTTVVGKPILEDAYIGKVIERSFLPLIKFLQPEVMDFAMPASGWFQGMAIVSINKTYPGQAKKVMMGLWGMGQLSLTKIIIVVDYDINIHKMDDVIWSITTRMDPSRDITIINNTPTDTLDPASPIVNMGSKLGVDATQKTVEENYNRPIPEQVVVDQNTKDLVDKKWNQY